jgi:conjugative relaxase-like TrwC/TraI family protein
MITVGVIRNGARYLSRHLRKNDYWSEGEKEVQGEWIGEGAKALGLEGVVDPAAFEALRLNRHPHNGTKLTPDTKRKEVAFFDIQFSAPKDVSVLAMVGGDERVRGAFTESVKIALAEMERYAAVRERRGDARTSETFRLTRNFVGAAFLHDASRDLDPQLHVHAVLANVTWDPERNQWMALQPAEMLRASPYVRQVFYRELASRLRQLGYDPHDLNSKGFSLRGLEHLRERFSKRTRQVERLAEQFAKEKRRKPTKREIEVLVKESRADKLTEVTTPEVRQRQRNELSNDEQTNLARLIRDAKSTHGRQQISHGLVRSVLEAALRHVYERKSVAREGDVLSAALELHPDFYRWRELREAMEVHPDAIRRHGEMTLRSISLEESQTVQRIRVGRNTRRPLGDVTQLPGKLTPGQRAAAAALIKSRDFTSVLIGDAGTGKTTVLSAIEAAHMAAGGERFLPLAPTTRSREALGSAGFESADTVQRFLVSEQLQREAAQRVVLVDEAGLLSTQQLDQLTRIAAEAKARVLLVGDVKQHYSVQRGDALRNVIRQADLPVVRLSEVLRQRDDSDRRFSRMLASGDAIDALSYANRRGMIQETGDDTALFLSAASHYAENLAQGVETLVVIPFWEEIDRFNEAARPALRRFGILGAEEVTREAVKPLTWTDEQKIHWDQYCVGDRLLFVRDTRFLKRGSSAEVIEVRKDGLQVKDSSGQVSKITRKQRGAYDVGRVQHLKIATGDRILMRGRDDSSDFSNGDLKTVKEVNPNTGEITFTDGKTLPTSFQAWTYGHALTSYRAQGSTAEESILVLGEVAERALKRRQFYVGNTRYRGKHRIYVSRRENIFRRLADPDAGRELATEFIARNRICHSERIALRHLKWAGERARAIWHSMVERLRATQRAAEQRVEI